MNHQAEAIRRKNKDWTGKGLIEFISKIEARSIEMNNQ